MNKLNLKSILNTIYQNHALIYKIFLFILTVIAIVYLFPKGGHFKYEFQKGKPWQYDNLYAPFDFAIQKSEDEIDKEKQQIEASKKLYFTYNENVIIRVKENLSNKIFQTLQDSLLRGYSRKSTIKFAEKFIDKAYKTGYLEKDDREKADDKQLVSVIKGNEITDVIFDQLLTTNDLKENITSHFKNSNYKFLENYFTSVFLEVLEPNVFYDNVWTIKAVEDELNKISYTEGLISENERIISKGDVVEGKKYQILESLKSEYQSQLWSKSNYNWIVFGYTILVALALSMLLLFLKNTESVFLKIIPR